MTTHAEIISKRGKTRRGERLFFAAMTAAIVFPVFAGFARTYYLRPYYQSHSLSPLLHLHGVVFTSWIVLFITQTALVAANRTRTHRQLGIIGGIIAGLMVVIGTLTAIIRAPHFDVPTGTNPLTFLTLSLGDVLLFGILVEAGLYYRRRVDTHKRLMLLATIVVLDAAINRLPITFIQDASIYTLFAVNDLFIVPCLIYDLVTRGRFHRATILGGLAIVISRPLCLLIGNTQAWLAFATWLTHSVN